MTTTRQQLTAAEVALSPDRSHVLPVLITRLLTRRRVIDQMRTASATCR
ncbi:MAG TPA: hypothetical protein VGD34_06510 [Kribbella sp.]|jgi:hypothetical protein